MSSEVIEERGIVRSVADGIAHVEIAQPYCEKEGKCSTCTCSTEGRMFLDLETDLDLHEGQEVTLQIKQPPILPAVFLVFVLPVLCLLAGIGIGRALFGPWGGALGVVFCAGSFTLAYLYDRHLRVTKQAGVRIRLRNEAP
ncbi:MAG: SoxR reducing system RseC family protein [Planctomycetes bacterium]|nr:SoxR reducing system RseC family protein [Planctomycetota bacterium]